jgi:salicylate hydroxylase
MLPFNTGGKQALEDCGALFALFSNLTCKTLIPERLVVFDRVRRKRVNKQQIVSSVPTEKVKYLADKLNMNQGTTDVSKTENAKRFIGGARGMSRCKGVEEYLLICRQI